MIHKYFINLHTQEAYHKCHATKGVMGLSQRVLPEIIAKIHGLVSIGSVEPVDVQRLLKHHINHYMCPGNLPDPNDRAYSPSLDGIKNHIGKAKWALQLSVVDQENAAKIVEKQRELSPDSHFYFRPYQKGLRCFIIKSARFGPIWFWKYFTVGSPRSLATAANADVQQYNKLNGCHV